jgi:hypothetical protein
MFAKGFRTGLVPNWYVILLKLHDWALEVYLHLPLDSEVFKQGQNLRAKIILFLKTNSLDRTYSWENNVSTTIKKC